MVAVAVQAVVDGARRRLDAQPPRDRPRNTSRRRTVREKNTNAATIVPTHEDELDPEVRADRVPADREQQPDAREQERDRAAERALEQHRAGDRRDLPGMAARRLEDARRVAADRRRQHLPDGVRDEVGARQPGDATRRRRAPRAAAASASAIGGTVTSVSAAERSSHGTLADVMMSFVFPTSTLLRM